MAKTQFSAVVVAQNGLTMDCQSRDFKFTLDEPPMLGGNDAGMNPVEALLNALGACKAIVARSFAQMKGINFTGLRVELEGTLDPDGFMGVNPDAKVGLSEIHTKFCFESDEPIEKLEEFVKFMAQVCPVMDTIVNAPVFVDEVVKI